MIRKCMLFFRDAWRLLRGKPLVGFELKDLDRKRR